MRRAEARLLRRAKHSSGPMVTVSQSPPGLLALAVLTTGQRPLLQNSVSCQLRATSTASPSMTATAGTGLGSRGSGDRSSCDESATR